MGKKKEKGNGRIIDWKERYERKVITKEGKTSPIGKNEERGNGEEGKENRKTKYC